jgi:hypothetical protein
MQFLLKGESSMHALVKSVRVLALSSGIVGAGLGLVFLVGTGGAPSALAQPPQKVERHPHLRAAIRELREAKRELKTAAHDFGGHRVEAIAAIDAAIIQLEAALKYDRK